MKTALIVLLLCGFAALSCLAASAEFDVDCLSTTEQRRALLQGLKPEGSAASTLIRLTSDLRLSDTESLTNEDWERLRRAEKLAREATSRLSMAELKEKALGGGKDAQPELYPLLLYRSLADEVRKICQDPTLKPVAPFLSYSLPHDRATSYPRGVELEPYFCARVPFARLVESVTQAGTFDYGEGYHRLESKFWNGPGAIKAEEFLRYEWKSFCGTGAGEFYDRRNEHILLSLLRERRVAEAVGASLWVSNSPPWMREPGREFDMWRGELLRFCGLDGDAILAASDNQEYLGASGSESGALRLLEGLLTAQPGYERTEIYRNLSFYFSSVHLSDALRQRIVASLVAELARKDIGFGDLREVLEVASRCDAPALRKAMRLLARHPSAILAARSCQLLRGWGEHVDEVAPLLPVRWRVQVNGQTWPLAPLRYMVEDASGSSKASGQARTNAEGLAVLPRDLFIDPYSRGEFIRFTYVSSGANPSEPQAWMEFQTRLPTSRLDETQALPFQTTSVPVEVSWPSPPVLESKWSISLRRVRSDRDAGEGFSVDYFCSKSTSPSQVSLSHVGFGSYLLEVTAPGYRKETVNFTAASGMPPVQIKLQKE